MGGYFCGSAPEMCHPKHVSIALLPDGMCPMDGVECLDLQLVWDSGGHCTTGWVCILSSLTVMVLLQSGLSREVEDRDILEKKKDHHHHQQQPT